MKRYLKNSNVMRLLHNYNVFQVIMAEKIELKFIFSFIYKNKFLMSF